MRKKLSFLFLFSLFFFLISSFVFPFKAEATFCGYKNRETTGSYNGNCPGGTWNCKNFKGNFSCPNPGDSCGQASSCPVIGLDTAFVANGGSGGAMTVSPVAGCQGTTAPTCNVAVKWLYWAEYANINYTVAAQVQTANGATWLADIDVYGYGDVNGAWFNSEDQFGAGGASVTLGCGKKYQFGIRRPPFEGSWAYFTGYWTYGPTCPAATPTPTPVPATCRITTASVSPGANGTSCVISPIAMSDSGWGATGIFIQRSPPGPLPGGGVYNNSFVSSYTDSNLTPGSTYQYNTGCAKCSGGGCAYTGYNGWQTCIVPTPPPTPTPTPTPVPVPGTVSGSVRDNTTNNPVSGVTISLYRCNFSTGSAYWDGWYCDFINSHYTGSDWSLYFPNVGSTTSGNGVDKPLGSWSLGYSINNLYILKQSSFYPLGPKNALAGCTADGTSTSQIRWFWSLLPSAGGCPGNIFYVNGPAPTPTPTPTPVPLPSLVFWASTTPIVQGASSFLNWNTSNVTSCSGSSSPGGWSWPGGLPNGTQTVTPATTTTYTLTCSGPGGSTGPKTTTITVTTLPAWFQTAGGDVHANGQVGTTIP